VLYLVIGEVKGTPPSATLQSLEQGLAALQRLIDLQAAGTLRSGGIFAGRMGITFTLDVESHAELHGVMASLPTFTQAEWQVIPLVSLEDDLAITRTAVDAYRRAAELP
jgi:hypothetical protein